MDLSLAAMGLALELRNAKPDDRITEVARPELGVAARLERTGTVTLVRLALAQPGVALDWAQPAALLDVTHAQSLRTLARKLHRELAAIAPRVASLTARTRLERSLTRPEHGALDTAQVNRLRGAGLAAFGGARSAGAA